MNRQIYRRRSGWQSGKFVIGYELREYRVTLPVAWPTVYRDPCASGDCPACDDPYVGPCVYCGKTFRFRWPRRWHTSRCTRHRT